MGGLLAVGLDDARPDDEYNWANDAYGYDKVWMDFVADGLFLGVDRMESIRRRFCMDPRDSLQLFDQRDGWFKSIV